MKVETAKIKEMFDYLSSGTAKIEWADGAFVFCRKDPLVAQRAVQLYDQGYISYIMFTGGIGKDSGDLATQGLTEAKYQAQIATINHVPTQAILLEETATNGGENCRKGIDTIVRAKVRHERLIVISHATQLHRVTPMLEQIAKEKSFYCRLQSTPTKYHFEPDNFIDQREVVLESCEFMNGQRKDGCQSKTTFQLYWQNTQSLCATTGKPKAFLTRVR